MSAYWFRNSIVPVLAHIIWISSLWDLQITLTDIIVHMISKRWDFGPLLFERIHVDSGEQCGVFEATGVIYLFRSTYNSHITKLFLSLLLLLFVLDIIFCCMSDRLVQSGASPTANQAVAGSSPESVKLFRWDLVMKKIYDHSHPTADSRAVVSYWRTHGT